MVDIILPQLGDSVTKALVTSWLKQPGERVERDEPLLEVTTDKVTVEVPSEYTGTVVELLVNEGDYATRDQVLCRIDEEHA